MSADILKLSPSEVYEFVTAALSLKQVPYIAGPPAIGKSQVVHGVADDANAFMIDVRLSQYLSEDLTGLPEKDESRGKAKYLPFETFPLEGDPIPAGYSGWLLFLDELSSASEEVLAAAYSLILDRTVGGKKLHPKCLVVAAGNRASDSAIARELPDTLITRMLPCEMKVSSKDWLYWADNHHSKNDSVVDFIRKDPKMLYAPTKAKERKELETYATPRGWEKVMAHVNLHEKTTKKEEEGVDASGVPTGQKIMSGEPVSPVIFNLMAAAVGPMAARSFKEEYDENIQLPYPWEIAQSPASSRIPGAGVAKARLMNDLSKFFMESDSQTRDNVLIYVNRVGGEYSELFLNEIKGKLKETPSDQRLLTETAQRLNIDPLLGTAPKGGSSSGSNPF
ncbi:N4 gp24-like protein [Roseovarius Plymouth podovirus 1]|uniref:N4 gp24-like protein n=2 Tax=Roseovarius Plymouth podovirus 1 TaxID=926474 RepID=K4Q4U2_9CAUD|nr:ATPase [Roseovarius Plymouth podovirus 1]CBW47012.1 N4 gp24-like protein [Roseovarius sp. 217 phage 1]CBX87949.1 N4 gp24-like protein [Roseovarius Plymouth podovirus 1]